MPLSHSKKQTGSIELAPFLLFLILAVSASFIVISHILTSSDLEKEMNTIGEIQHSLANPDSNNRSPIVKTTHWGSPIGISSSIRGNARTTYLAYPQVPASFCISFVRKLLPISDSLKIGSLGEPGSFAPQEIILPNGNINLLVVATECRKNTGFVVALRP